MFSTGTLVGILIFLLGVIVGLFVPLACVKLYSAVGGSLGEICDEEDEHAV